MPHTSLISTLVVGLALAFLLGAVAHRLRISPIVGYLLAGIAVGPYTPGFVADQTLAPQLAEIGIILLMFGVGLQFSPKELLTVKSIAVPGALVQIAVATLVGMGLAWAMGWPAGSGLVFGLALSIASTVVVIRVLDDRRLLDSTVGRISVGWLIVEDLVMILAIVLLPTLAGLLGAGDASPAASATVPSLSDIATEVGLTVAKTMAFIAVMLIIGQRAIPWILHHIAHTGSRELFRLGVLTLALGVAFAASELVGVSFALGAFFAGLVLSESELSQRAAAEALPLRDAFAVLFFVSVGMLFDPAIFIHEPWPVLGTVLVVTVAKPIAALAAMRALGCLPRTALAVAASRTQIGEFSFILAGLGVTVGLLPETGRDLILAGAMVSIIATPAFFLAADRAAAWYEADGEAEAGGRANEAAAAPRDDAVREMTTTDLVDHTVIVGYGRVGSLLCDGLRQKGERFLVIEEQRERVDRLRELGIEAIHGHVPGHEVTKASNIAAAARLFIAIPDGFEAGQIAEQARAANPDLRIVARAHSDAEAEHLLKYGADAVILGERELARAMLAGDGTGAPPES